MSQFNTSMTALPEDFENIADRHIRDIANTVKALPDDVNSLIVECAMLITKNKSLSTLMSNEMNSLTRLVMSQLCSKYLPEEMFKYSYGLPITKFTNKSSNANAFPDAMETMRYMSIGVALDRKYGLTVTEMTMEILGTVFLNRKRTDAGMVVLDEDRLKKYCGVSKHEDPFSPHQMIFKNSLFFEEEPEKAMSLCDELINAISSDIRLDDFLAISRYVDALYVDSKGFKLYKRHPRPSLACYELVSSSGKRLYMKTQEIDLISRNLSLGVASLTNAKYHIFKWILTKYHNESMFDDFQYYRV